VKKKIVPRRKDRSSEEKDRPATKKTALVKKDRPATKKTSVVKKKTVPATKTHKNRPFEEKDRQEAPHEKESRYHKDCVKTLQRNL
jgi:hypothetical protein